MVLVVCKISGLIFGTEFGTDVCTDKNRAVIFIFCDVVFVTSVLNLWNSENKPSFDLSTEDPTTPPLQSW